MTELTANQHLTRHVGACHCGTVKFEFLDKEHLQVLNCNCSVCRRTKFEHVIVPKHRFKLLTEEGDLAEYQFGTKTAKHTFCKVCGVKPFYSPRSHPDSFSVNLRCVDQSTVTGTSVEDFDGENWERARERLQDRE